MADAPLFAERDDAVLRLSASAFTAKGNLDSFWQEVAINHYPERADFTTTRLVGDDITSQLYSSEPVLFRREFGNFIGAILRPKGRKWFNIMARQAKLRELTSVKTWLEPRSDNLRGILYNRRSGYTRAMTTADHDYVTFGNCVGSVEETPDQQGMRFRTWHLRDCAWRQNLDGIVDTIFRKFTPTVRDILGMEKKGWTPSQKVKDMRDKEPDHKINCIHVEMPIMDYDYSIKNPKFDWVSLYYDVDHKCLMSYKNVPEFDYFVDRWFLIDGSPYGISPCVVCSLPDARSLQVMTWSIIEAGEKAVEPPLIGVHDAILGGVNIGAGMVTWADKNYDERTGEVLRALELGGSPQFGEEIRKGITSNLNAAWFLNKLFMPQTYDKTAYEAARIHEEFIRTMQPIMEPAEAERNGNHLEIALTKAMRLELLGPLTGMPRELSGQSVDFDYDNPMEDARKQEDTFAYKSAMEVNSITAQFDPTVMEQFDYNKAYRAAINGVAPPDWLVPEDQAKQLVDQAKKKQQLSAAAAEAASMAATAGKAGMTGGPAAGPPQAPAAPEQGMFPG